MITSQAGMIRVFPPALLLHWPWLITPCLSHSAAHSVTFPLVYSPAGVWCQTRTISCIGTAACPVAPRKTSCLHPYKVLRVCDCVLLGAACFFNLHVLCLLCVFVCVMLLLLTLRGYWCDTVDPRSGTALHSTPGSHYDEVIGASVLLGYDRVTPAGQSFSLISHPEAATQVGGKPGHAAAWLSGNTCLLCACGWPACSCKVVTVLSGEGAGVCRCGQL